MVWFVPLIALSCLILNTSRVHAWKPCLEPSVRREWNSLSDTERADWITAVKCLGKLPHDSSLTPSVDPTISIIPPVNTSSSYYDDLVYVHMDLNVKIHFTGLFLPWHRGFVRAFEVALQEKCGYKGTQPYWDWSQHAGDIFGGDPIFDPSPTSGFGTNGDPNNDWQVADGGFAKGFTLSYPVHHTIRREYTLQPWVGFPQIFPDAPNPWDENTFANATFTKAEVKKLVNGYEGNFTGFQQEFERLTGAHAGIHLILGGDMSGTCPATAPSTCVPGPKWSTNDPLFFMHHSMVDKVWYDWQKRRLSNFWAFHGGTIQAFQNSTAFAQYPNGEPPFMNFNTTMPADGMYAEETIYNMMDTTGGTLCYVYE